MRLSRIHIENFRNFHHLDVAVGESVVILGENQVGKTNLLHALRLVLDPSLPDSLRQLRIEDFWDGIPRPLPVETHIRVSVEIVDFEEDEGHLAVLAEHLIQADPMVARLTYQFCPLPMLANPPSKGEDFEFVTYGGNRQENKFGYELRKRLPLEILHALRDAETDLGRWTKSPLRPLVERTKDKIERTELEAVAKGVSAETEKLTQLDAVKELTEQINGKLKDMAGPSQTILTSLGFSPTDPDKLLRSLRLLFDGGSRDIAESSLGTANVLYLAMRALNLEALVEEGSREHTFFGIEEPEAHLHPHLQRLVYRSYLRRHNENEDGKDNPSRVTYLLTTHSPHIASVTPVNSLVFLRRDTGGGATIGSSGCAIDLTETERDDIERYLDVSRAEGLFGRGVLLVEGDAEKYLVPVLAKRAGYDLDALGISICSVAGTNFVPYLKFFGPQGLDLPVAVITDLDTYYAKDETWKNYGTKRAHSLCALLNLGDEAPDTIGTPELYEQYGIFLNGSTLEIELNQSGCIDAMNSAFQALCSVGAAKKRFEELSEKAMKAESVVPIDDPTRFIKDIEYVGKGRFAQRLCAELLEFDLKHDVCPLYIQKALRYVTK